MARSHEPVRMSRARAAALVRAARLGIAVLAVQHDSDAARAAQAVDLIHHRYLGEDSDSEADPTVGPQAQPPRMFITHPEGPTT